jgi:hypothetical protein
MGDFTSTMARESIMEIGVHQKKKIQGLPHVFYIWKI